MHTQPSLPFGNLPPFPGVSGCGTSSKFRETNFHKTGFVRSVVEEAGLSRFVYLQGVSGRRYVFSAIKPEQTGLYERAVFANGGVDGSAVSLSCSVGANSLDQDTLTYVHLLAESDCVSDVIADLSGAMQ